MKKGKNSCTLLAFVSGRLELCSVYSWSELASIGPTSFCSNSSFCFLTFCCLTWVSGG